MSIMKVKSHSVSSKSCVFGNSMRIFTISYYKVNNMKVTKNIVQRLSIIRNILT